jgi:hypothetical protein
VAAEFTSIIQKIQSVIQADKTMRTALSTVLAIHKPRIFENGFNVNGSKIGVYSKRPLTIPENKQARKTGKVYFKGGYSEYKTIIGKNPGFVILRNTDQMFMDYGLIGSGTSFGFGFHNSSNYEKSQHMEKKYGGRGAIFDLSGYEEKVLGDTLTKLIEAALT